MICEREMTLARTWDFRDLTGWFWSEKFDGCRAYWDGSKFWTRDGNVIPAPKAFTSALPRIPLDGELWAGRGRFQEARVAVQSGKWTNAMRFAVFDAPSTTGNWLARMAAARLAIGDSNPSAFCAACGVVQHREQASDIAAGIIKAGGEGAMFRNPKVRNYQRKRTVNLQRIKKGNLYEPWRKESGSRAKAWNDRANGILDKARNAGRNSTKSRTAQDARQVVGLDVRLFPFDPEIDWNIRRWLSADADSRELTKI